MSIHHHAHSAPDMKVDLTRGYDVESFCAHLRSKDHAEGRVVVDYLESHGADVDFARRGDAPTPRQWSQLASALDTLHQGVDAAKAWEHVGLLARGALAHERVAAKFEDFCHVNALLRPQAGRLIEDGRFDPAITDMLLGSLSTPAQLRHAQDWASAIAEKAASAIERAGGPDPLADSHARKAVERFEMGLMLLPEGMRAAAEAELHAKLAMGDPRLSDGHGGLSMAAKLRLGRLESDASDHAKPSTAYLGNGF